ncbi:MAG: ATP-dependent RNA helicase DeaD [Planctomycetes bacterium]|nr:ATP-dependent RNA helicase DeaD [Planctomycetota bacterium]
MDMKKTDDTAPRTFDLAPAALRTALAAKGYETATPVQAAVMEAGAAGRDLLVSAQTGSGKTVAYGLALAASLLDTEGRLGPPAEPRALVVTPTRELALQVQAELAWLFGACDARIASCVGGMDPRAERRELQRGAHVVVGTPGRLVDHVERGQLDLSKLAAVVLDEADEMLDLGFREELERLLDAAPPARRTLLFSATLPPEIVALAKRYQRDALRIATNAKDEPHGDIEYRAVLIAPHERERAVVNVLRYLDPRGALVFCATRDGVSHLHAQLQERGFSAVTLSGELSQNERTRALHALRDGRARVCVATDVAARGLDIPDLGLVLHADLPQNAETLKHRSGRTGRAGRKGTCAILVPHHARRKAERLLQWANVKAKWSAPPTADQIRESDRKRVIDEIAALAADPSEDDLAVGKELLARLTPDQVAAALAKVQRGLRPAPEDIAPDAPPRGGAEDRGGPRRARPAPGESAWFRMSVGRHGNADPKWIVPFLCRRGHITSAEIGRIVIRERETRFEIDVRVAERFAQAARAPDSQDGDIEIESCPAPAR